jgi:hypothetical protein
MAVLMYINRYQINRGFYSFMKRSQILGRGNARQMIWVLLKTTFTSENGRSQVRIQLAWKLHLRFKASRVAGSLVPLVANLQVCLFHYRRSRAQHVSPGQPLSAIFDPAFAAAVAYKGCQIFSGYNLPKGVKNTQWPQNYRMGIKWQYNNPNNLKAYQHFPFQGTPKCI